MSKSKGHNADEAPFIRKFLDHLLEKNWYLVFSADDPYDMEAQKRILESLGYKWRHESDETSIPAEIFISREDKRLVPCADIQLPARSLTLRFTNIQMSLDYFRKSLKDRFGPSKVYAEERKYLSKMFKEKAVNDIDRGTKKPIPHKRLYLDRPPKNKHKPKP